MFERLLDGVPGIGHDWQVLVTRPGLSDAIEIRVELLDGMSARSVEKAILASLQERFPDMVRNLAMGLCAIQVLGVPRGSLRTGRKLRSVVDLRKTLFSAEAAVPASRPV
jgi:phenylacetate-coenzyme A ligase PaaK-like adenylate-forming protein